MLLTVAIHSPDRIFHRMKSEGSRPYEHTSVVDARIEFDHHRPADDVLEEITRGRLGTHFGGGRALLATPRNRGPNYSKCLQTQPITCSLS